ncbi:MAG: Ig-like domain-containing protein, partial [Nannocystis sp.]
MTTRPRPLVVSGLGLLLSSCPARQQPVQGPDAGDVDEEVADDPAIAAPATGLEFTLAEGKPVEQAPVRPPLAPAKPLGEREVKALLARLPALPSDPDEAKDFALRPASQPPPKTGTTVFASFPGPPQGQPPPVASGPLEVLRHAPDGEVPIAADLSLTFSQPMVPVTSRDDLAATEVPVQLSPQPPGVWTWVGTKTLLFRPTDRFPMATEYRVEVPAGVAAIKGGKLGEAAQFSFATPPPTLVTAPLRNTTTSRRPRIFIAFDQRIDPAAVLPSIKLRPAGGPPVALHLVPPAEALKHKDLRAAIESTEPGRWLVVQADQALPPASEIKVVLAAGLPSAEGPRKTTAPQEFTFQTFGPLKLVSAECGWGQPDCPPGAPLRFSFTTELDARKFKKEWVHVDPPIPGMQVVTSGTELIVTGATRARTRYSVRIDPPLRDVHGQQLGVAIAHKFDVGPAPATLQAPLDVLSVLDPAADGRISVFSTGHKQLRVRVHAVTPADWDAYLSFLRVRNEDRLRRGAPPPGKSVFDDVVPVKTDPDTLGETRIDLRAALPGGLGHAIVIVEPTRPPKEPWQQQEVITWAQATRIGLDAFVDDEQLVGFATRLADGTPLPGVQLQLLPGAVKGSTGADGLARLALAKKGSRVLLATQGEDRTFLPEQVGWWYGDSDETGWRRTERPAELLWYVFDDRQMYRPGETARVKGWLRQRTGCVRGCLDLPTEAAKQIRYTLHDSQGNKLLTGTRPVNALGGFDLTLTLPKTPNLGHAQLELEVIAGTMKGQQGAHAIQIQEFRRPEYEVEARADEGPHLIGGHADLTVTAMYFAGGKLTDVETTWAVSTTPGSFSPPNHDDFTFGRWRPWWTFMGTGRGGWGGHYEPEQPPQYLGGRTDGAGEHHLRIDFAKVTPIEASSVHAAATVIDVNRQPWTSSVDLLVHPASIYVGIKSERLFVQEGEPLNIDAIVAEIDGALVTGSEILMRAERMVWEQVGDEWKEVAKDPQDCRKSSTVAPQRCSFIPKLGGTYRITATVKDPQGRLNESQLTLWVAGGEQPPARSVEQEQVQVIPDKQEYAAGDSAKLLVLAPFAPAEGVLTLRREGLVSTRRFTMKTAWTTLEVPLAAAFAPGVVAHVDLVGSAPRLRDGKPDPTLPRRPAYAAGHVDLAVPPRARALNLYLKPGAEKLEPGGSTRLEVLVQDADNKPVPGSEVAVVVVDEAVLALSDYKLLDPLALFFPQRGPGVADYHNRARVTLARPEDVAHGVPGGVVGGALGGAAGGAVDMAESGRDSTRTRTTSLEAPAPPPAPPGAPMTKHSPGGPAIALRQNFDALALFAASLPTDAQGRASVDIKLPDNLSRYRIMAVAVAGSDRFGKAESAITARLPLMVRPSPPRFLNYGDSFELPIVVQNQTDEPMIVDLAARTSNLDLSKGAGRRIEVRANDAVEVRLPAIAVKAGTARFQVAAASGKWSDAATLSLPVWTPATTEAFATYGQVDAGAIAQPIKPPTAAIKEFGGLELSTTSTAVAELTDAVLYLVRYPYECSEQLASRMLTIAALKDVLSAFQVEGMPTPAALIAFVDADIERLARLQNPDGGFSFWRRGDRSWPYLTIHVAHALERARGKGFKVPPAVLDRAQDYLKSIESRFDADYSKDIRRPIIAYALYVRARLGVRDTARARS